MKHCQGQEGNYVKDPPKLYLVCQCAGGILCGGLDRCIGNLQSHKGHSRLGMIEIGKETLRERGLGYFPGWV